MNTYLLFISSINKDDDISIKQTGQTNIINNKVIDTKIGNIYLSHRIVNSISRILENKIINQNQFC